MDLGKKVISSLKWMALLKFSGQIINWVATIFVIRLLSPADYGLMAQAVIVIGLCSLVNEMGLGSALIQRKNVEGKILRQVFGAAICINSLLFLLLAFIAPLIADFFKEPQLVNIIYLLAAGFLINSFFIVPNALLSREMAFKKKAIVDLVSMLIASISTLILAIQGQGVWALVIGNLLGIISRTLCINIAMRYWQLPSFNFSGMKSVFTFGGVVTGDRVLWYLYSQSDIVIVGKLLGKEFLGFYSVAMQLATLPMQKISGMLNEVSFAAFSNSANDGSKFTWHFVKAARLLCVFAFPVFWGISAVSAELVVVFLGPKWMDAILPMQILSMIVPLRMLSTIASPALAAKGLPGVSLQNLMIACLIMPAAFLFGVKWGLLGVSLAWLIAYPLTFMFMQYRALKALEVSVRLYVKEVSKPIIPAIGMYLAVMLMRYMTESVIPINLLSLLILVVTGALVFGLSMLLTQKSLVKETMAVIRS